MLILKGPCPSLPFSTMWRLYPCISASRITPVTALWKKHGIPWKPDSTKGSGEMHCVQQGLDLTCKVSLCPTLATERWGSRGQCPLLSLLGEGEILASQADTSLERRGTSSCLWISGALYWLTQSVFVIPQAESCFQPSTSTKSVGAAVPDANPAGWRYESRSCKHCTDTCGRAKFHLADFPMYSKGGCGYWGLTLIWQSNTRCRIPAAAHW